MPVEAHRRPLLDERRAGDFGCLLGRALLTIHRTASDETFWERHRHPYAEDALDPDGVPRA